MLCNQAPVSITPASQSTTSSTSNLEHFLSQYMLHNESKFHSIQQTLHKAETNYPKSHTKHEPTLALKHVNVDSNSDSSMALSDKTVATVDSSQKLSPNSSATPTGSTMLEVLTEESHKRSKSNKLAAGLRQKAKTLHTKKNEAVQVKAGRLTAPGFWSPYKQKEAGSNTESSFISDKNTVQSVQSDEKTLVLDNDPNSQSEEEEDGGFLMIKPISTGISNPKFHQPQKTQNFNLHLEEALFPKEITNFANSLQEANLGAYVRTLIQFLYSYRNKNRFFSAKRPISEAVYSIYFEGETLGMFKKLLEQVLEKLKEESITLKQKYRSEIEYIESKNSKILRTGNARSIKFEEKELQKLQAKVVNILQERMLMDSQNVLSQMHHFLDKILEKFPSLYRPNAFKLGKSIIIDNITLAKLMERLLEGSNTWSSFYKTTVIYTYDLYMTPQNLLLYLIMRYFEPEPLNMSASELRVYREETLKHFKLHILRLMKFWIEERSGDFIRNPDLLTMLTTFLDLVQPLETEPETKDLLKSLYAEHEGLSQSILKQKQKLCEKADLLISPHSNSTHSHSRPDISLVTRVISASDTVSIKDETPSLKPNISLVKSRVFGEVIAPVVTKADSLTALVPYKPKIMDDSRKINMQSVSPKHNNKFGGFWGGLQSKNKVQYTYKMLLEDDNEEIAKHLTVIDWKYFSKINISEMIKKRWTKGDKAECPNYWKYVRRFNSFCSWIQYIVLSQESFRRRIEIVGKFLEIALICLKTYNNYSSSHYIFAAVSSLEKFGVITLQDRLAFCYDELKKTFVTQENFLAVYKEVFNTMKTPAIPNLNFFLQSFLKLQDGVVFWAKLPESSEYRYLKFPLLVQIHDSCKEMKKFQRIGYEDLQMQKNELLYKFLKKDFKKGISIHLEDRDEALSELTKMVGQVKEKQNKLFNFFGVKTSPKNSVF